MKDKHNNSYKIAYLLAQYLNGKLEGDELSEFQDWVLQDKANEQLLHELQSEKNFKERERILNNISLEKEWNRFSRLVKYKRITLKHRFIQIGRYAAVLMIPLLTILLVVRYYEPEEKKQAKVATEIAPGTQGATLVLSNGKQIVLGMGEEKIEETDGTLISTDSTSIEYLAQDLQDEELIYNEIKVNRGQEFKMQLVDGTKVWINSMSSIKFPVKFVGNTREVEITGEVYFEVEHDKSKPFIVHTPVHDIKVLGTSFNISSYKNNAYVHTTLVAGKVAVENITGDLKNIELNPNQQYLYHKKGLKGSIENVNTAPYVAWTKGYFHFEEETLEEIFKKLERWYEIEVFYKSNDSRKEIFNGRLPRFENAETILSMIEKVSNVKIITNENIIIIN